MQAAGAGSNRLGADLLIAYAFHSTDFFPLSKDRRCACPSSAMKKQMKFAGRDCDRRATVASVIAFENRQTFTHDGPDAGDLAQVSTESHVHWYTGVLYSSTVSPMMARS